MSGRKLVECIKIVFNFLLYKYNFSIIVYFYMKQRNNMILD